MKIEITTNKDTTIIALSGKLTVNTAPDFQNAIENITFPPNRVIVNLSQLDYISSAGLRLLIQLQKMAYNNGAVLNIEKPNATVSEIFDMTGLSDVFTIVN